MRKPVATRSFSPAPSSAVTRSPYKTLVILIVVLAAVLVALPWIFGPRIELLPSPYPGNPLALTLSIANQNLTPFTDIDYVCTAENVEAASGAFDHDPKAVHAGRRLRLAGRAAMAAKCDMAYFITVPLKGAGYKFTMQYRIFPWRSVRAAEYHFGARLDDAGHVTGWFQK